VRLDRRAPQPAVSRAPGLTTLNSRPACAFRGAFALPTDDARGGFVLARVG
jgi:hypothetical protein